MYRCLSIVAVSAAWLLASAPQRSHADLILQLQSGASTVTVVDNGAGDGDPTVGMIWYNGSSTIGGFEIGMSTSAYSKPVLGSGGEATFDLHLDVSSTAAGELTVRMTDTGFSLTDNASPWVLTSQIGGLSDGTVIFQESYDAANGEFGASTTNGPVTLDGAPDFSTILASAIAQNSPLFSLTEIFTILHGEGGGRTTFDASSAVIAHPTPEPASLLLWGAGAAGFGYWRMRRRRPTQRA